VLKSLVLVALGESFGAGRCHGAASLKSSVDPVSGAVVVPTGQLRRTMEDFKLNEFEVAAAHVESEIHHVGFNDR
jgi:hypothetical protein